MPETMTTPPAELALSCKLMTKLAGQIQRTLFVCELSKASKRGET